MLAPDNLSRYHAHWVTPDPAVADVVDQYWHVSWNLGDRSIDQRIIDAPAVTLTVEEGDVPAPLVITGVQARACTARFRAAEGSSPYGCDRRDSPSSARCRPSAWPTPRFP